MRNQTKKLIGKGAFTKAYLLDSGNVLLDSCCPIKEIMSLGWFPNSYLFPELKRVEQGYEMEYYPRVSSLKQNLNLRNWKYYKELRRVASNISSGTMYGEWDGYHLISNAFQGIKYKYLRDNMLEALDSAVNVGGDLGFEISPRNVATKKGRLVLLDVFYHKGTLKRMTGRA